MSESYTHKKLTDVEDTAPGFGMGEIQEARFATEGLEARDTGFSLHHLNPGKRQPFGHKHQNAEEVYVVIGGAGRAKVDDDIVALERLDALRIAPGAMRAFEGGPDGLELLAFGPRHEGDGEMEQGWWVD